MAKPMTGMEKRKATVDRRIALQMDTFIEAYGRWGTIKKACEVAKMSRTTFLAWIEDDRNGFRNRFADAKADFADEVEQTLFDQIKQPKPNPLLLIFANKAHKPDKYRDSARPTDVANASIDLIKEIRKQARQERRDSEAIEIEGEFRELPDSKNEQDAQ